MEAWTAGTVPWFTGGAQSAFSMIIPAGHCTECLQLLVFWDLLLYVWGPRGEESK